MIDLNKYYIAKTYDGVSGNYAGRPGFVPQATTGDIGKFLRADGTWASINISGLNLNINIMSGATSSADGASGLVPKPLAGDDKKYLRGDGAWSDPTISTIQYIENSNDIILDVTNYSTFVINITGSSIFSYSGFQNGKTINVYLGANHTGYLPHVFPANTTFSELGDNNVIYSFQGYVTRLLLQNIGNQVVNFSSISVMTPLTGSYYYGTNTNTDDPPGVGLDIIEEYLQNLLEELGYND
jgi:hypothetical protein